MGNFYLQYLRESLAGESDRVLLLRSDLFGNGEGLFFLFSPLTGDGEGVRFRRSTRAGFDSSFAGEGEGVRRRRGCRSSCFSTVSVFGEGEGVRRLLSTRGTLSSGDRERRRLSCSGERERRRLSRLSGECRRSWRGRSELRFRSGSGRARFLSSWSRLASASASFAFLSCSTRISAGTPEGSRWADKSRFQSSRMNTAASCSPRKPSRLS